MLWEKILCPCAVLRQSRGSEWAATVPLSAKGGFGHPPTESVESGEIDKIVTRKDWQAAGDGETQRGRVGFASANVTTPISDTSQLDRERIPLV